MKNTVIKLLQYNTEENLDVLGYDHTFLYMIPKAQSMDKIDKLNIIKIKTFCYVKDTVRRMKEQSTDWEKIQMTYLINDCYLKYTKNIFNTQQKENPIKIGQRP